MKGRHDLTDVKWALIAPLLPNKRCGMLQVDDRRMISGIFSILSTGALWHNLPECCGAVHDNLQPLTQGGGLAAGARCPGQAFSELAWPHRLPDCALPSTRRRREKAAATPFRTP
ncbi:MAG: transposase [Gammaproteobacteria bacterium]|nr:MAG: transposase [Gammaproteobacteria bacterium]